MMKHALLALAIAACVLPASALAKGPAGASIDGPGNGGGITFGGDEASGPLGALTEQAGFFPAAFGQEPSPMLAGRPKGELGRKYTITYTVPGPYNDVFTIRQDVYPYAEPSPVTYTAPGQPIFDTRTRGGWFRADPALKQTLVAAGLPNSVPASRSTSGSSSDFPTTYVSVLTVVLLAALGASAALVIRRRTRPAAA
jgi:hypothetical protein